MKRKAKVKLTTQSRRGFLASVIRGVIGTGLAVTGGYLLLRDRSDTLCEEDFACNACGRLRQCILPEATSYKIRELQHPKKKEEK